MEVEQYTWRILEYWFMAEEKFQCSADNPTWCSLTPMLQRELAPAIEFFKTCAYVAGSVYTNAQTAEVLPLSDGLPSQCTTMLPWGLVWNRPVSMLASFGQSIAETAFHTRMSPFHYPTSSSKPPHLILKATPNSSIHAFDETFRFHAPCAAI
nr:hypothetical protein HmN_000622500 [Hymenolepis microstoma]